jgi:hypothetical protein
MNNPKAPETSQTENLLMLILYGHLQKIGQNLAGKATCKIHRKSLHEYMKSLF